MVNNSLTPVQRKDPTVDPKTNFIQTPENAPVSEDPVQNLLGRRSGVRQLPSGSWQAICPAHDDHNPSLSISQGNDGRALVKCHAGCEIGDVLHALDLTKADLFPVSDAGKTTPVGRKSEIVACYDYRDASGDLRYQDEGGEFISIISGRYSRTGQSNFDVFLKGHSGSPIRVDRADRNRPSTTINNPSIVLMLYVQPEVIQRLFLRQEFVDRGLIPRILWVIPPNPLGGRVARAPGIPDSIMSKYKYCIMELLRKSHSTGSETGPITLSLAHDAAELLFDFMDALEPDFGSGGAYEHLSGWAGKLSGNVVRIAGLLHIAQNPEEPNPENTPISGTTMDAALRLGRYFLAHAKQAYAMYQGNQEEKMRTRILEWLRGRNCKTFTERELYKGLGVTKNQLTEPLMSLKDEGYIIETCETTQDVKQRLGRKPSKRWVILSPDETNSVNSGNSGNGVSI